MPQKIYFDESGFTGNNLLSKDQPFFAYASVASDDAEAKEFVEYLIQKYNIKGTELKGSTLVNSSRYRYAVDELLMHFRGRMRSIINEKKYALSGKFFEYIFEPVLARKSSLFYGCSFHRFIANYLFFSLIAKKSNAEEIHIAFEDAMRDKRPLEELLTPSKYIDSDEIISEIISFATAHQHIIEEEISGLEGTGIQKWILDLTTAGLYNLLADWGTRYPSLIAICDSSKPLSENLDAFNRMIGVSKKEFISVREQSIPLTFNLYQEIIQTDSKIAHGIQIADVIAATSVFILNEKNKNDKFYRKWLELFEKEIFYWQCCVVPSPENLDRSRFETNFNRYLLQELSSRSDKGQDILDKIEDHFRYLNRVVPLLS